jgi:hypothetical protein
MNATLSDTMSAFLVEIGAGVGASGELFVDHFDYEANPIGSTARSTFCVTDGELLIDHFDYQVNPVGSTARSTFTITDVEWSV